MTKRSLSPGLLLPAKRIHIGETVSRTQKQSRTFDGSFYDELILCIFSHLSWIDLCLTQSTNRNWARLAADNELWRKKYLCEFGKTRLRGGRGFIGRLDGREVKPLPGHGKAKAEEYKDWKWMFRISSNWRKGRCLVEEFPVPQSALTNAPTRVQSLSSWNCWTQEIHILLAGPWTIMASSKETENPVVHLIGRLNRQHVIPFYDNSRRHDIVESITALALDQSPPISGHISLAVFLSSGEFSVFEFSPTSPPPCATRRCTYRPSRQTTRTMNIRQAVYHHPLLVTLSEMFSLSIYDLSSGAVRLTQTLTSFTSYPPASMVLSSPSPMIYKLVIAYAIPVYPKHWSVGATELMIAKSTDALPSFSSSSTTFSSPSFQEEYKYPLGSTMSIISSRTIRGFDVPTGWIDDSALRIMREQWGRKLYSVADAQTDGKWIVIAPGANAQTLIDEAQSDSSLPSNASTTSYNSPTSLQLYRLVLPAQSNSVSASPPKLTFVRTLHGQLSTVSALSLADGRCVSLNQNGSIWVWDLEAGTGAQVAPADTVIKKALMKGTVLFDDRQIVSAYGGKVVVRRFDV